MRPLGDVHVRLWLGLYEHDITWHDLAQHDYALSVHVTEHTMPYHDS